jgi:hypothetical protein
VDARYVDGLCRQRLPAISKEWEVSGKPFLAIAAKA